LTQLLNRQLRKDKRKRTKGIKSMVIKCPSCGWLFQAKEVKRELLGADTIVQKDPLAPAPMEWEYQHSFDKKTRAHTFRVYYKCKHCGHEWTDLIQKK
jgi:uncharacterized Zn finger protein